MSFSPHLLIVPRFRGEDNFRGCHRESDWADGAFHDYSVREFQISMTGFFLSKKIRNLLQIFRKTWEMNLFEHILHPDGTVLRCFLCAHHSESPWLP